MVALAQSDSAVHEDTRPDNNCDGDYTHNRLCYLDRTMNVRLWHKANCHCQCPLLGVKRTSRGHALMSANDPRGHQPSARLGHRLAVRVTSSSSSSSGTKPLPPHVGHCCSSFVPLSMTPSPLQAGQILVFTCAPPSRRSIGDQGLYGCLRSSHPAKWQPPEGPPRFLRSPECRVQPRPSYRPGS